MVTVDIYSTTRGTFHLMASKYTCTYCTDDFKQIMYVHVHIC